MTNAPVYYALAQAQFNPVTAMAKYVPDIQDIFRKAGYTLFETQEITQLQIVGITGQETTRPEVMQTTNWIISKADRTSGFILGSSSLAYHTTQYETRNEFLPELIQGLESVHKVVTLEHFSRVGLRYLDAVIPNKEESVEQYLADGLKGISFGTKRKYASNESVFETETAPIIKLGTLVLRVYRAISTLGYPPDLFPHGLQPNKIFKYNAKIVDHAVIDTDHFVEGLMPIDFEKIRKQMESLHSAIKLSFKAAITEHAKNIWK